MSNHDENPVYPIDVNIFKEHTSLSFLKILDSLPDKERTLIIEKSCIQKLNYIISTKKLTEKKITKTFLFESKEDFHSPTPILIYIIPPNPNFLSIIEKHILLNSATQFHLIFIPKITIECDNYISQSKTKSSYNIHNLNIDMFALDYDLISLEDYSAFRNIYVKDNYECLSSLKRVIYKFEAAFGKIKYRYSKGNLAYKLNKILSEQKDSFDNNKENEIFSIFIFDRNVDMITPFCTNVVYEALINDYFEINLNTIKVPPKVLEKESKQDFIKLDLSRNDKFYTAIKDFSISKIGSYLQERLIVRTNILTEGKKRTNDAKKVYEDLVIANKVQEEYESLNNNTNLADYILKQQQIPLQKLYSNFQFNMLTGMFPDKLHDFIDDEIAKKSDKYNILKILCLECIIYGGIRYKFYEQFEKDFLITYGYKNILLWKNLEKAGLIKTQDNDLFFTTACNDLNLIYPDIDVNNPNDSSYVFGGYCPIIIRLIEKAFNGGWGVIKDTVKKIPGETHYPSDESEIINNNYNDIKYFLVVFIGGITYGELAAIRYLNKTYKNKKFVVLTTSMINYKNIFDSLS